MWQGGATALDSGAVAGPGVGMTGAGGGAGMGTGIWKRETAEAGRGQCDERRKEIKFSITPEGLTLTLSKEAVG